MNPILKALEADRAQMTEWFEHMHRNPELSMREEKTARYIADIVKGWGYDVEEGIGKYGIVASMAVGDSDKAIGLRADFDALPIQEVNDLDYKSQVDGVARSEEHTSELQSRGHLVCRLLLEKKKKQ